MKTTFDLPDALVHDVKRIARARGTTAREIVQQALMRVVQEDASEVKFELRDASVPGWNATLDAWPGMSLHDVVLSTYDRDE